VGYPSRVSRKGKASPLEAGRGKYSPPASPERVTSKAQKRKDKGFRSSKIEFDIYSTGYETTPHKTAETPVNSLLTIDNLLPRKPKQFFC
jgi:hypothetical protein